MKRSHKIAVGILASVSLGLAALSAHANPGAAGGMGRGMTGPNAQQHQGQATGAHPGRMMQEHQGGHGAGQRDAAAGSTGGCPMHAQRAAQDTHAH